MGSYVFLGGTRIAIYWSQSQDLFVGDGWEYEYRYGLETYCMCSCIVRSTRHGNRFIQCQSGVLLQAKKGRVVLALQGDGPVLSCLRLETAPASVAGGSMLRSPGLAERAPVAVEVVASGRVGLTVAVLLRGAGVCALLLLAAPGPQPWSRDRLWWLERGPRWLVDSWLWTAG
ncbi:unnamed protein product [Boreogadus saida]